MSKRIHELAKEWNVLAKDLIAGLEKLGIRGKRSQSSLTDEEVARVRESLGLTPRPTVSVGTERVVAERVVGARHRRGTARHGSRADDRDATPRQRHPAAHRARGPEARG